MTNEPTQTATIHPSRVTTTMILIIMALLILNLAATFYTASHTPECIPAIERRK